MTAASATAGCDSSTSCTSRAYTEYPPCLMTSLLRPTKRTVPNSPCAPGRPCAANRPRSAWPLSPRGSSSSPSTRPDPSPRARRPRRTAPRRPHRRPPAAGSRETEAHAIHPDRHRSTAATPSRPHRLRLRPCRSPRRTAPRPTDRGRERARRPHPLEPVRQLGRHRIGARGPDPDDERSRRSAPASNIMRYIAGTPMKIVDRRSSMASSTPSGRNRPSVTGMPAQARAMSTAKPMMWATGRLGRPRRGWSRDGQAAPRRTWPTSARWVSSAPFGLPVVPEV